MVTYHVVPRPTSHCLCVFIRDGITNTCLAISMMAEKDHSCRYAYALKINYAKLGCKERSFVLHILTTFAFRTSIVLRILSSRYFRRVHEWSFSAIIRVRDPHCFVKINCYIVLLMSAIEHAIGQYVANVSVVCLS